MATALNELVREGKRAIKSILPQPVLNWREVQYYEKYGEIELHILEFLCDECETALSFEHFEEPVRKEILLTLGAR